MANRSSDPKGQETSPLEVNRGNEIRTTVDKVVAAGKLLSSSRKCRLWHESWLEDGLPTQTLAERSGIPESSAYNVTREMIQEGSLYPSGRSDQNATILKPTSMQMFVSNHPEGIGPQFNVHSTLIGVVGRGVKTSDVDAFLERHNYTLLSEAITGVLVVLSDSESSKNLESFFKWMDPVDARLIEGHIARVLEREGKKPDIDWQFPDDPAIQPTRCMNEAKVSR